jgi:F-type H+-transporting ATPase subunit epsilon
MHLEVLLPFSVFLQASDVSRIVAETSAGSFGLLPHRLDCVAALEPGILTCETAAGGETFIAVDVGILVKCGDGVRVSVRRALADGDLAQLREAVEREFRTLDDEARARRAVLARLESGFVSRLASLRHG